MTGEEREILRDEIMHEVYDYYYKNGGEPFRISKEKLKIDTERKLAVDNLIDRGLLKGQSLDNLLLSPTPYGIDYVENKK